VVQVEGCSSVLCALAVRFSCPGLTPQPAPTGSPHAVRVQILAPRLRLFSSGINTAGPSNLTITASQPLDRDPTRIYCTSNAESFQLTTVSQKRRNLLAVNSACWLSYRQVHPRTAPTSTREVLRSRPVGQIYEPSHLHCFTTRVTLHTIPTISIKSLTFTTYYSSSSTSPHPLWIFPRLPKACRISGEAPGRASSRPALDTTPLSPLAMAIQTLVFAAIAVVFFTIRYLNRTDVAKIKNLPEIPGVPIFGNLLQLGDEHAKKAGEWAKKYGPVFQVRMGNRVRLCLTSS
jgi:hypothetical protein